MTSAALRIALFAILAGALWPSRPANGAGPDYIRKLDPPDDTLEDADGLLRGLDEKEFPDSLFFEPTEEPPSFWGGTRLTVKPRNYYFDRDRDSGESVAWAQGGIVEYMSGAWRERFRVAGSLFTTQKLYGPDDKDGTLLLGPGQDSFSVMGEAYGEWRFTEDVKLRAGRTMLSLPYINREDNRMLPNSFLVYAMDVEAADSLEFLAAHVTHMKRRNSDEFEPMSRAAGLAGTDEPASVASVRYEWAEHANVGVVNLYAWDFMNTFYVAGNLGRTFNDELDVGLSLQYTDQRSVGDELDGNFETYAFSARLNATWRGWTPSVAFSTTDDDSGIRSPFGSDPGYLSLMVEDFNRAGEDAWLVGLAYDFAGIGLRGVSAFANYAEGDAPGLPDQTELNLTLDIRPTEGLWDTFWLSLRRARVNRSGGDDLRDWRVILNYEVPVLGGP